VNWNLVRKTISDRWRGTAIYAGALAAYVLMLTAMFPSFQKMTGVKEMLENYPESMSRFFGVESIDITSFNNFMAMELLGLMFVIIVGAFVFSFARYMVAGELRDGTLELLLAQPIQRWKMLTSKGAVLLAGIVGIVLATVLSVFAFGAAFGIDVSHAGFLAYAPVAIALFVAIAGYSILFSTALYRPRWVVMASVGVTLGFYMMNFAATSSQSLEKLGYFTIFHYYNPLKVLDSGSVPVGDVLVLLGIGAACFAASIYFFQRKDIAS